MAIENARKKGEPVPYIVKRTKWFSHGTTIELTVAGLFAALLCCPAVAQSLQLRGLNNNAASNLPSAEQQIQRFQNKQQSTFSNRQSIDQLERRLQQQNLHQRSVDRTADPCLSAPDKCQKTK